MGTGAWATNPLLTGIELGTPDAGSFWLNLGEGAEGQLSLGYADERAATEGEGLLERAFAGEDAEFLREQVDIERRGADVVLSARLTTYAVKQLLGGFPPEGRTAVEVARTGAFATAILFPAIAKILVRAARARAATTETSGGTPRR